jgi:hypothetical protein
VRGETLVEKLSFLKGGEGKRPEEERLMQLFQNRAGLKKAYADLKDEYHLLLDRLKQQEGATIRVQEQFDALGELLGDPQSGLGALVFFQLRALWKTCHQQLATFGAELARQQEAREVEKHKTDMLVIQATRLSEVDDRLRAAATTADEQRALLTDVQSQVNRLTAFWHYFKRRSLQKSVELLRSQVLTADAAVGDLHAERSAIENEVLPEFPGLSLSARRNINLAVIGYAELLCEQVDEYALTARTKEAVARRVHEMNFGSREGCESYMQRVQKALNAISNQKQVTGAVKIKLDRLRSTSQYRNSADTVPSAESLMSLPPPNESGQPVPAAAWNVLSEDYWDVYSLLLR